MYPTADYCRTTLSDSVGIIQAAVLTKNTGTIPDLCETSGSHQAGLEAGDSRACNIGLPSNVAAEDLRWTLENLVKPWSSVFERPIIPRVSLQVGIDPFEHPINLDVEEYSREFAEFRSYSSLVPKRFKKIGKFLR